MCPQPVVTVPLGASCASEGSCACTLDLAAHTPPDVHCGLASRAHGGLPGTPGHDGRADGDVPAVHDRRLRGVAVRRAELMHRLLLSNDCGRCCGKRGRRVMPRQRETARSVACPSRRTETRRWAAAHRGPRSALGVAAQPGSRAGLGACRPTWGRARGL